MMTPAEARRAEPLPCPEHAEGYICRECSPRDGAQACGTSGCYGAAVAIVDGEPICADCYAHWYEDVMEGAA